MLATTPVFADCALIWEIASVTLEFDNVISTLLMYKVPALISFSYTGLE